jgi:hypothetical protein
MWEDNSYCWVVMSKNNWFHRRQNLFYQHRIPLAETDVYTPPPALKNSLTVRRDDYHKEYLCKPSNVLRHDQELPASFVPHPLFQMEFMPRAVESSAQRPSSSQRVLISGVVNACPWTWFSSSEDNPQKGNCSRKLLSQSLKAHGALVVSSAKVELGPILFT